MENEFTGVMAGRSDQELIVIVTTDRNKYQPLAVEAAEKEIEKRGINAEQKQTFQMQSIDEAQNHHDFDMRRADGGVRFANFLIDMIAIVLLFIVSTAGLFAIGLEVQEESLVPLMICGFIYFGYYVSMECAWQQRLGKMVTGTKVVTATDDVPTNGDIIARTFCRLIPFDRLSFLFSKSGFHDSISKTAVIYK